MQDALDMVLCGIMCKKLSLSCVAMKDGYEHCACTAWLLLSSWLFFCLPRRGFEIRAESPQCSTLLVSRSRRVRHPLRGRWLRAPGKAEATSSPRAQGRMGVHRRARSISAAFNHAEPFNPRP